MTLVVQSFGNETEYRRALLTIISYYAHTSLPIEAAKVILFTDHPGYFEPFVTGFRIDYVLLTPEKIKNMRGKIDFLHRMKIALIEEAFRMIEGPMLYADSDTFFVSDPSPLVQQLSSTKAFMHLPEYRFEALEKLPLPAGKTFHAFLNLIKGKSFELADGKDLQIFPGQESWNAGVMFFHPHHARFIPDVYALTDQFYPATRNHASEQYAFSVMLQNNTELLRCDPVIYHYWYRVKKKIADEFLLTRLTAEWSKKQPGKKLADIKDWCELLPGYFQDHLLTVQDNAIQALNEDRFSEGYRLALKALLKKPTDKNFIVDVLYHTKRNLGRKHDQS